MSKFFILAALIFTPFSGFTIENIVKEHCTNNCRPCRPCPSATPPPLAALTLPPAYSEFLLITDGITTPQNFFNTGENIVFNQTGLSNNALSLSGTGAGQVILVNEPGIYKINYGFNATINGGDSGFGIANMQLSFVGLYDIPESFLYVDGVTIDDVAYPNYSTTTFFIRLAVGDTLKVNLSVSNGTPNVAVGFGDPGTVGAFINFTRVDRFAVIP